MQTACVWKARARRRGFRRKTPRRLPRQTYAENEIAGSIRSYRQPAMATDRYYLKAMNCPHHHRIFAAEPRSYRDLPLRLAEYGTCYRYEQSGELFGLMRVRSLNMNDAHIYCTPEQFAAGVQRGERDVSQIFQDLRHREIRDAVQHHAPRRHGQEIRRRAGVVEADRGHGPREVLKSQRHQLTSRCRTKRRFTARRSTCRSGAPSAASSPSRPTRWISPCRASSAWCIGTGTTPTKRRSCIHRAPLGTHERFIGFLIEHYAGNFPLWLAPEQVRVLTIGEDGRWWISPRASWRNCAPAWSAPTGDYTNDKINGKIQQRRAGQSAHDAGGWPARPAGRRRQRPRAWQRQPRRETAGRSHGGHSAIHQGKAQSRQWQYRGAFGKAGRGRGGCRGWVAKQPGSR